MAHDFENKNVGTVALIIGAVILVLGLSGILVKLDCTRMLVSATIFPQ